MTEAPDALHNSCMVLHPHIRDAGSGRRTPEQALAELVNLAAAIDLRVLEARVVPVAAPKPATLFTPGTVEMLAEEVEALEPTVVIVDHALSPVQHRNLERTWRAKVLDRTQLILEIFGARARTREGRLQVELASQSFQRSRLVRSWTHLERQRGGAGFMGGPGERQLELDRRMIGDRIDRLKAQLEEVRRTRGLHRAARDRVPYPVVSLVGYTNAGKSTLFNRLAGASVMAKDMLFATLDPTMRAVRLPNAETVILSDTVGFISDLPTSLVAAFRATLEEVEGADLILHVRDIAHPETEAQRADVLDVLKGLGIDTDDDHVIEVWNKIDALPPSEQAETTTRAAALGAVAVTAFQGVGMEALAEAMGWAFDRDRQVGTVILDAGDGAALAFLHRHGDVRAQGMLEANGAVAGDRLQLQVALSPADWGRFRSRFSQADISTA